MSRRSAIGFGVALVLAATFGAIVTLAPPWSSRPEAPEPGGPVMPESGSASTRAFLDSLRDDARAKGIHADVLDRVTRGLATDTEIAALNANQPEHTKSTGDYVNLLVSDQRIANGLVKLAEQSALLDRIEKAYGVDKHIVLAIWGVESNYGTATGDRSVIRSLSTLAMTDPRRAAFWRGELLAALSIVQRGDISAEAMTGSWAGAMGHTQFMPSTYLAHAVDFDGDGRRDIWTAPADALASAANYLKQSGWLPGQPPAVEVALPAKFDFALSAPEVSKSGTDWLALDLKPTREEASLAQLQRLALVVPAGHAGPAFLTSQNFRAILRYNRAVPYALAVSLLADRLAGRPSLAAQWPATDRALSRTEREELQTRLTALGHDIGAVDGIIGSATRNAIRLFQRATGLPQDGHPDAALLNRLRQAAGKLGQ